MRGGVGVGETGSMDKQIWEELMLLRGLVCEVEAQDSGILVPRNAVPALEHETRSVAGLRKFGFSVQGRVVRS